MESSINSTTSTLTTASTSTNTTQAASSFINLFLNEVNQPDIQGLRDVQRSLLEQLDKTNEKLDNVNKFSAKRYLDAQRDFVSHTRMLTTMKSDLDAIFKRIRLLKIRLSKKYLSAYQSVMQTNSSQNNTLDDEDEDEEDFTTSTKSAANSSLVKSKTIDCSQIPSTLRESYSLVQISSTNNNEQTENSFNTVRRFVIDNSSGGQDLSTLFKNARNEIKKFNENFIGSQKSSDDNN